MGNNIQQISNAIYFCRKNEIDFSSPESIYLNSISIKFGNNHYKIRENSNNWFYFFNGLDADFQPDIEELNSQRKAICEEYILPALKVNHEDLKNPLGYDTLVVHIRSGDVYSNRTHPSYVQNPIHYFLELNRMFNGKVIYVAEDENNPIVHYLKQLDKSIDIRYLSAEDAYTLLLRAKNIATSGVGTFALAAIFCSKNIKRVYSTNLFMDNVLNPDMLKEQLEVYRMDIDHNKYINIGDWKIIPENLTKILEYCDNISFRRL